MIDPRVIAVAEIRRTELLEHAAQHRLARLAASPRRRRQQPKSSLRRAVTAMCARVSATRRRRDAMTPTKVAPAAETPANAAIPTSA